MPIRDGLATTRGVRHEPVSGAASYNTGAVDSKARGPAVIAALAIPKSGWQSAADLCRMAVTGFPSAETYGQFIDAMTRNGFQGVAMMDAAFDPFVRCTSPTLLVLSWVRESADV